MVNASNVIHHAVDAMAQHSMIAKRMLVKKAIIGMQVLGIPHTHTALLA